MQRIKDYTPFFSRKALRREPSPIRELQPLLSIPGMYGLPELVSWLRSHQEKEHRLQKVYPSPEDWQVCITTGSQDALSKAFDMLLNEGDYIITEDPTYSGSLAALRGMGIHCVGIPTDAAGMDPEALERTLAKWNFQEKPLRVIYTIPTGQNPSGSTLSQERREKLLSIASKYNLLIIEDDPYWHLQLLSSSPSSPLSSLLSMDTEGRVLRVDSLSKVVAAGIRMGWATGPTPLVEKLQLDQQASALHASGLSQVVLLKLLEEWKEEGWTTQLRKVQEEYSQRAHTLHTSASKHLKGLAEWSLPVAGMFLWLRLLGVSDSTELIKKKAVEAKVLLVPGSSFSPSGSPSPFVRASFSTATQEDMELAMERLASLLRKNQK